MLTCADVRATNPKLWNSWKASLFHEFYERVKRALRRGIESALDQEELVLVVGDSQARAVGRRHQLHHPPQVRDVERPDRRAALAASSRVSCATASRAQLGCSIEARG